MSDEFEDLLHGLAAAHQTERVFLGGPHRPDRHRLSHVPRRLEPLLDYSPELGDVQGLEQVVVSPQFHRFDGRLRCAIGGHQNHQQPGVRLPDPPQRFQPAHPGHPNVHDDKIGLHLGNQTQTFFPAGGFNDFQVRSLE